jgi:hypothetical protein
VASLFDPDDPDGACIAEATLELPQNGTTARLLRIKRGAGLLNFYFGRGRRWVLVDTPDGRVKGRLHTRWEGIRRSWEVTLQAVPREGPDAPPGGTDPSSSKPPSP